MALVVFFSFSFCLFHLNGFVVWGFGHLSNYQKQLNRNKCVTRLLLQNTGSPSPLTPAGSCRFDSSLGNFTTGAFMWSFSVSGDINSNIHLVFSGLLTKKFINLIKHAEDGILDLNNAAETLEVNLFATYKIY